MDERTSTSLQTEFVGFPLRNPFLLASGPPTQTGEMIARAFAQGWAGAVTKTLKPPSLRRAWLQQEPQPMLAPYRYKGRNIAMENIATAGSILTLKEWQEQIPAVKAQYPDRLVIGSIAAPLDETDWAWLADGMLAAGVDALELDVSCSHSSAQLVHGRPIGEVSKLAARVTGWVARLSDRPVLVKLPAFVPDFEGVVVACADAGAAAVSGINTVPCLIGVNLDTFEPLPSVAGHTAYGGLSGPAIKPLALYAVSRMVRAGRLPVSGIGGISVWEDAAEFLLIGATTLQVCTAVMWGGYSLIEPLAAGLSAYLARQGLGSVRELVGRANAWVEPGLDHLPSPGDLTATIVAERCQGCSLCLVACQDGGVGAIVRDGDKVLVNARVCKGCGLCLVVCPLDAVVLEMAAETGI